MDFIRRFKNFFHEGQSASAPERADARECAPASVATAHEKCHASPNPNWESDPREQRAFCEGVAASMPRAQRLRGQGEHRVKIDDAIRAGIDLSKFYYLEQVLLSMRHSDGQIEIGNNFDGDMASIFLKPIDNEEWPNGISQASIFAVLKTEECESIPVVLTMRGQSGDTNGYGWCAAKVGVHQPLAKTSRHLSIFHDSNPSADIAYNIKTEYARQRVGLLHGLLQGHDADGGLYMLGMKEDSPQKPTKMRYDADPSSPFGTALNCCLGISAGSLRQMLVVPNGDTLDSPYLLKDSTEIWKYDFASVTVKHAFIVAYLSYGDDGFLTIFAYRTSKGSVRICFMPIPKFRAEDERVALRSLALEFVPACFELSEQTFKKMRDKISRRVAEGQRISEEEEDLLGHNLPAHLSFARAKEAVKENNLGNALMHFMLGAHLFQQSQNDHYDMRAHLRLIHQLVFLLSSMGLNDLASYYLDEVRTIDTEAFDKNQSMEIDLINSLTATKDKSLPDVLRNKIRNLETELILANAGGSSAFNKTYYDFLRRRLCYALIDQGQKAEAQLRLSSLLADSEAENRRFALDAKYYLLDAKA